MRTKLLCFQNTLIYRASNSESHPFRQEIETAISSAADGSTVHWMYSCDKVRKNNPLEIQIYWFLPQFQLWQGAKLSFDFLCYAHNHCHGNINRRNHKTINWVKCFKLLLIRWNVVNCWIHKKKNNCVILNWVRLNISNSILHVNKVERRAARPIIVFRHFWLL